MTRCRSKQTAYAVRYNKLYRAGYRMTVDSTGARRRVQSLHAIGFTRAQLMEATGLSKTFLYELSAGDKFPSIQKRHDAKIREVYRTLCVQPQHNSSGAKKIRTYAKKRGWAPPMAWDDIDDPKCRPRGHLREPAKPKGKCRNHYCTETEVYRGFCRVHYRKLRYRTEKEVVNLGRE